MKKLLITGGAGFIGSHLCERLLDAGHDVLCVDNLFMQSLTGVSTNSSRILPGRPARASRLLNAHRVGELGKRPRAGCRSIPIPGPRGAERVLRAFLGPSSTVVVTKEYWQKHNRSRYEEPPASAGTFPQPYKGLDGTDCRQDEPLGRNGRPDFWRGNRLKNR